MCHEGVRGVRKMSNGIRKVLYVVRIVSSDCVKIEPKDWAWIYVNM